MVIKLKNVIFVAESRNYNIFVAKIYDYVLIKNFEDLLGSSIAPQVMPHWIEFYLILIWALPRLPLLRLQSKILVQGFDEIKFLSNSIFSRTGRPGKQNLFICGRFHLSAAPNCKKQCTSVLLQYDHIDCHTGSHPAPVQMMLKVDDAQGGFANISFLHFWGRAGQGSVRNFIGRG